MNPVIHLKQTTPIFLVALLLGCFALSPRARAVIPAPDGGYPGGNTAEGQSAMLGLTTGGYNTAVGLLSLRSNTTGAFNTAIGAGTLLANTADQNTASGAGALLSNTTGPFNTANGVFALFNNTTGYSNTANGRGVLFNNTTGFENTATGINALFNNTIGQQNTAIGTGALLSNTTGNANTADGGSALFSNTTGHDNTAVGSGALFSNTTGFFNTAICSQALQANTTGTYNTAQGIGALINNTTGNNNTALGANAGPEVTTATNVIVIGSLNAANIDNSCWMANIYATTTQSGTTLPVIVSDSGQLGTASSSRRFKKDIKPMNVASESILALKPVTFHYKSDKTGTAQFGLIAEEVAQVNPDLVVRDKNGEIYTVRYDAVNAMLLNEFLKEHRKVENLKNDFQAAVAQQQKEIAALTAIVKEQASQIQKVSAQFEVSKPAPQLVEKNQ
jgi:hypothetical protein